MIILAERGEFDRHAAELALTEHLLGLLKASPKLFCDDGHSEAPRSRPAPLAHLHSMSTAVRIVLDCAHEALRRWFGGKLGAWSIETYGDRDEDESKVETTIFHALVWRWPASDLRLWRPGKIGRSCA